jgi:hypothetical protein
MKNDQAIGFLMFVAKLAPEIWALFEESGGNVPAARKIMRAERARYNADDKKIADQFYGKSKK